MSRPLRIEYPNAWYHVMNRGRRLESIFSEVEDYRQFTQLLQETSEMWNIRITAFCLMPNHYHMLVQTPEANIARSMRHLNGVYTQRYNRRHKCDGQLFRGRYKSILISNDSYLLQAVRYIHRNPLQSNLVQNIDDYRWSSHRGYISVAKKWDWLYKNHILSMLSNNREHWLQKYKKWVAVDVEDEFKKQINRVKWPICVGPQSFLDRIKERYGLEKFNREIPSSRELLPDVNTIVKTVCCHYGVSESELVKSRRGKTNPARNTAVYLARKLRRDTYKEIGASFQIHNERSVRSIVERMKTQLAKDRDLTQELQKLVQMINKD